jgi:hypothetical protein
MMLSDALLNAFSVKEYNAGANLARWANINGGGASGNALVIATPLNESLDSFKLKKVKVCK